MTASPRRGFEAARAAALLLALGASAARAELADGLRLAAEGRCAEALPLLAAGAEPAAARAHALCLLQEADYGAAAEELARLAPGDPSLATDLGIARFHAGDAAGAEAALRQAEAQSDRRPEIGLYLGLIALSRARSDEAAFRLERAASAPDDPLAPAAAYYAGIARARGGDTAAARAQLERVARSWPDTPWATEARRAAAGLGDAQRGFASLRVGFEHDTNAVLRGEGVVLPSEIPAQSDQRFVWRAGGGRAFTLGPATQLGGALAFRGSLHGDLTRFDVLHPSATLWADRRLGERTTLRGVAAYSRAWVGTEDFLSEPSVTLELHHSGERSAVRAFAELTFDDYRFESLETDPVLRRARDRDGLGVRLGADTRWTLAGGAALIAGAAYRRFTADGTEYSFDGPELALGAELPLPARFQLTGRLGYGYRHYRHPTTYAPTPIERREHDVRTELALGRPIWRQVRLETRWRYQRNLSTAAPFDYRRHVIGLYLTWTRNP